METNQPLLCMSANVWAWCVCITLIWVTSVKQHFHSQNSIFLSVWILFCWGDIALWWSHRSQGRYVIWVTLAALWGLCLAAGWLKPSVPSQAWINQAAADEKWGRGREKFSRQIPPRRRSDLSPPTFDLTPYWRNENVATLQLLRYQKASVYFPNLLRSALCHGRDEPIPWQPLKSYKR